MLLEKLRQRIQDRDVALEVGTVILLMMLWIISSTGGLQKCIYLICCFWELVLHSFIFGILLNKSDQNSDSCGALGCWLCLQRAIDEKFSSLEEKEKELRQLCLAVRERDHDLERLRGILSSNEATMQVRAKSVMTWYPSPTWILNLKHHPFHHFLKTRIFALLKNIYTKANKNSSH